VLCLEGLARKIGESMLRLSPGQRNQWEAVIVFSQHSVASAACRSSNRDRVRTSVVLAISHPSDPISDQYLAP